MSNLALAIDIGSILTKVAWRDEAGNVSLVRFGEDTYLPSLFYLPADSEDILLGQEALQAYEDDPLGVVEKLKKLIVRNKPIYITEDRATNALPLLVQLFSYIKQYTLDTIPAFQGMSPEHIVITVPGNAPETLEFKLRRAASAVAWDRPQFLAEPIAAARYWLYGEGHEVGDTVLVVLDCGGGTTDWACLQRSGSRIHRAEKYQYAPSAISVGGSDVDQALSNWVAEQQPELHSTRPEPRLRDQLRVWKETVFNGEEQPPIRIKGKPLQLNENDLHRLYSETLIAQVLPAFERFLEPIVHEHPDTQVLIVGGSATKLMEKAVKSLHTKVACCDETLGAVILGALAQSLDKTPNKVDFSLKTLFADHPDVIRFLNNYEFELQFYSKQERSYQFRKLLLLIAIRLATQPIDTGIGKRLIHDILVSIIIYSIQVFHQNSIDICNRQILYRLTQSLVDMFYEFRSIDVKEKYIAIETKKEKIERIVGSKPIYQVKKEKQVVKEEYVALEENWKVNIATGIGVYVGLFKGVSSLLNDGDFKENFNKGVEDCMDAFGARDKVSKTKYNEILVDVENIIGFEPIKEDFFDEVLIEVERERVVGKQYLAGGYVVIEALLALGIGIEQAAPLSNLEIDFQAFLSKGLQIIKRHIGQLKVLIDSIVDNSDSEAEANLTILIEEIFLEINPNLSQFDEFEDDWKLTQIYLNLMTSRMI